MEDLAELAALATRIAAREHLTVVPAVPQHDYGPEVCLGPDEIDLPGFLELADKLGGGVLYLRAAPFDPDAVYRSPPEDPSAEQGNQERSRPWTSWSGWQ